MDRDGKKKRIAMIHWNQEKRVSSSPVLPRNRLDSEQEIRAERELYAELEFMTLASLVQQPPDPPSIGATESKASCGLPWRSVELSYRCCLRVTNVLLIVVFLCVSISLLILYLHTASQQHNGEQIAEELQMNQSRCQQKLESLQELNKSLQRNITTLIQDTESQQESTLSQLQQAQAQCLQETQRIMQSYWQMFQNYTDLREAYNQTRHTYLLLPRGSAILLNCQPRKPHNDGTICPFCRSGWQFFGVSCYTLSLGAANWQESARWCRMEGGHLAVVNNLEEQHFLQDLVTKTSWIGLSDRDLEGDWRWVDGTPYEKSAKTFKLWMANQPDNFGNEDCVSISPDSGWNDEKCLKSYPSVCEHLAFQVLLHGDTITN